MKWIKIFASKEEMETRLVLGKLFTVGIGTSRVCLLRSEKGIMAFDAKCPHAGASLSDGFVNEQNEIVCPLHSYRFDLKDGREKTGHACELLFYATDLLSDGFYIRFR